MPMNKVITVYQYEELSDRAKEKARQWYLQDGLSDEWWDGVYEMVETAAALLGIEFDTRPVQLMGGGVRRDPMIFFNGFYHQGQGSSFAGHYGYEKGCKKAIAKEFPEDKDLQKIAADLVEIQKAEAYQLTARITSKSDTWISVEVGHAEYSCPDLKDGSEDGIEQAMRDFNSWIFRCLRDEYEFLTSDEVVAESIIANEYTFDEDGNRE